MSLCLDSNGSAHIIYFRLAFSRTILFLKLLLIQSGLYFLITGLLIKKVIIITMIPFNFPGIQKKRTYKKRDKKMKRARQ